MVAIQHVSALKIIWIKNVARTVRAEITSFNQDHSFICVLFETIVSCFESLNHQVMISAMFNRSHDCPYHKQCNLMSKGLTDNTCVVTCQCK